MSKKHARRFLQSLKKGCTVKEFLRLCDDMGFYFEMIADYPELTEAYQALIR